MVRSILSVYRGPRPGIGPVVPAVLARHCTTVDPAVKERFQRIEDALASVAVSQASVAMSQERARRRMDRMERMMGAMKSFGALVEANLREITEKLNGLVGVVENWPRQKAIGIRSRLRLERGSP